MAGNIASGVMIRITPDTRKRLRDAGYYGETYDGIINRALDALGTNHAPGEKGESKEDRP